MIKMWWSHRGCNLVISRKAISIKRHFIWRGIPRKMSLLLSVDRNCWYSKSYKKWKGNGRGCTEDVYIGKRGGTVNDVNMNHFCERGFIVKATTCCCALGFLISSIHSGEAEIRCLSLPRTVFFVDSYRFFIALIWAEKASNRNDVIRHQFLFSGIYVQSHEFVSIWLVRIHLATGHYHRFV